FRLRRSSSLSLFTKSCIISIILCIQLFYHISGACGLFRQSRTAHSLPVSGPILGAASGSQIQLSQETGLQANIARGEITWDDLETALPLDAPTTATDCG
ncbi:MAG TPA: hypothetical protein PLA74_07680, partial [Syntrophales bacterium]|nr:hypothetical protein [Syntrophales bacterium]